MFESENQAKRLAEVVTTELVFNLEVKFEDDDSNLDEIHRDIGRIVKNALENELEQMALEEAAGLEPLVGFAADMANPEIARNYVLSLSKEIVSQRSKIAVLRDLCKRQQGEHAAHLDTQAVMHQKELDGLRQQITQLEDHITEMNQLAPEND